MYKEKEVMAERLEKIAADEWQNRETGSVQGVAGMMIGDVDTANRVPLLERVSMDMRRASQELRKLHRLAELQALLEKNPDVARILDLIEEVRV